MGVLLMVVVRWVLVRMVLVVVVVFMGVVWVEGVCIVVLPLRMRMVLRVVLLLRVPWVRITLPPMTMGMAVGLACSGFRSARRSIEEAHQAALLRSHHALHVRKCTQVPQPI